MQKTINKIGLDITSMASKAMPSLAIARSARHSCSNRGIGR